MKVDLRRVKLIGQGCEARCFEVSRRIVLKAYWTVKDRDAAWERQRLAYRLGIGPRTLGRIDRPVRGYHGYLSARADMDTWVSADAYRALENTVKMLGWETYDIVGNNTGVWKGHTVLVDFGETTLLDG